MVMADSIKTKIVQCDECKELADASQKYEAIKVDFDDTQLFQGRSIARIIGYQSLEADS